MASRRANPALPLDILRVTAELIEEKGPDALTMREVAERLGYSATTIYLYYKDKEDLIEAAIDRAFELFADSQARVHSGKSDLDAVRLRSRAYVEWGLDHPNLYRAMFERAQRHSDERSQMRRSSYRAFAETVSRLMDEGVLRRVEDIAEVVNVSWATNHGIVSLAISGRLFGPIGERMTLEEAKRRTGEMVDAAFDQWLAALSS